MMFGGVVMSFVDRNRGMDDRWGNCLSLYDWLDGLMDLNGNKVS